MLHTTSHQTTIVVMLSITIPSLTTRRKEIPKVLSWHYCHIFSIISPLIHNWDELSEIDKNTNTCIALYYIKSTTKEDYAIFGFITNYFLEIIFQDLESIKLQLESILETLGDPALELRTTSKPSKSQIWFTSQNQGKVNDEVINNEN